MFTHNLIDLVNKVCKLKAEEQTLELKAAHAGCPKRLYDTISSFANQDAGGIILFGIDEEQDYAIVGVYDAQDLQKKVTEQCLQMEPVVRPVFTIAEIDSKVVCAAEIPAIDISERPCYYRGAGKPKGSFVRVGDADLPMTAYEIYRYEAFRKHLHDDERPVERATMDMLNQDLLQKYIMQRRVERPGFALLSNEQTNEMLNITKKGVPTLAAVMNFGIYPQGYFPQLGITGIVVGGTEIGDTDTQGSRFINNKRIEGTIAEMVDAAIVFCNRSMKIRTTIDAKTGKRIDTPEYPIEALREAVLNSLIHRDYSFHTEGTPVQIDFFVDRVEIHSPGTLYGRMSVEDLGIARPDLRNPTLAVMAESLTESENRYSGIPTMRRAMERLGLPEPKFENRRNEFVVTLYNTPNTVEEKDNDYLKHRTNSNLLDFCRSPRTKQEIADYLGIKTLFYVMQKYVKPLLQSGELAMVMPDKPQSSKQKYYTVC